MAGQSAAARVSRKVRGVVRDYGPVIGGMGAARVLNFAASALLARALGVTAFGAYAVTYTLLTLVSQAPSVIDVSFVRHYGVGTDEGERVRYVRAHLQIKVALAVFLCVAGIAAAPVVARVLLHSTDDAALVAAAIAAGAFLMMAHSGLTYLQARASFVRYGVFAFALSAIGLVVLAVYLVFVDAPTPMGSMLTFNTVYYGVAAAVVVVLLARISSAGGRDVARQRRDLIGFSGWLVPATLLYTLLQRVDVLVLARLADRSEVGLYGGAVTLAAVASVFTSNLSTVFLPKAASVVRGDHRLRAYVIEAGLLIAGIAAVVGVAIAAAPLLVHVVLGDRYVGAIAPLRALLVAYAFVSLEPAMSALLYAAGRTFPVLVQRAIELVVAVLGALVLVPRLGSVGAAAAMAAAYLAGGLVLMAALFRGRLHARAAVAAPPTADPSVTPDEGDEHEGL